MVDKPIGITSFDVLRKLKKILNIKKMGHTGTLDPLASGLVLVGVGNYTKLIPYFEKDKKEYEFKINLDGITDSFDTETGVTYLSNEEKEYFKKELNQDLIQNILKTKFTGKIFQIPPKYSAIKIGGKKAVNMARKGINFELKKREITIFNIELLGFNYPELYLRALVSAGTYIRSIASDLGEILGTGGYITYLRRNIIGKLDSNLSQNLNNFDITKKLKDEDIFDKDKFIKLFGSDLDDLNNGKIIKNNFKNLKDGQEYFIKNNDYITNIIKINGNEIIPIRKI